MPPKFTEHLDDTSDLSHPELNTSLESILNEQRIHDISGSNTRVGSTTSFSSTSTKASSAAGKPRISRTASDTHADAMAGAVDEEKMGAVAKKLRRLTMGKKSG